MEIGRPDVAADLLSNRSEASRRVASRGQSPAIFQTKALSAPDSGPGEGISSHAWDRVSEKDYQRVLAGIAEARRTGDEEAKAAPSRLHRRAETWRAVPGIYFRRRHRARADIPRTKPEAPANR